MSFPVTVALLTALAALAACLPGIYLTLGNRAMLIDAISHSLLPGIVIGFLLTKSFSSPVLFLLALASALAVTIVNNLLTKSRLLAPGSAQSMIAPAMLSLGVILVSAFTRNLHMDVHVIMVGDPNLIAFNKLCFADTCFGPQHSWLLAVLTLANLLFILVYKKSLNAAVFDYDFALTRFLSPATAITILMFSTAVTVTAAFAATGSILAITMVVAPAAIARILVNSIKYILPLTLLIAAVASQIGYWIAYWLNLPTSATIAFVYGIIFIIALFSKKLRFSSLMIRLRAARAQ